jgi:6-phosphogluconolactonase
VEPLALEPLDWSRVTVIPVDERWVEEEHADSNAGLIKRYLLQNKAATAHFVGMKTPSDSAFESESEVNIKLAPYASCIDVAVLGMGEDGHTASFFPGAQTLPRAMDPAGTECCVAVRPPTAEHDRMTLSLSALLRARHAYLHIAGLAKQEVLSLASEPGDTATMPIRALLHSDSLELDIYFAKRN